MLKKIALLCVLLGGRAALQAQTFDQNQAACNDNTSKSALIKACQAVIASREADNDDKQQAYKNLGAAYGEQGKLDEAISSFDAAVRIDPKDCETYMARGSAYLLKGDVDRAIQDYSAADARSPRGFCEFDDPREQLGLAYFIQGDFQSAVGALTGAHSKLHKTIPPLLYFSQRHLGLDTRAQLATGLNDIKRASETPVPPGRFRAATWTNFDEASMKVLLGTGSAEQLLAAAQDIDSETNSGYHSTAWFTLGELALFDGRIAEAKQDFETAMQFGWENTGYQLARAELRRLPPIPAEIASDRSPGRRPVASTPTEPIGSFYALVIGIDAYPPPLRRLTTAVQDANAVAAVLASKYGFQVRQIPEQQATRTNILKAIRSYANLLGEHDNLLIYYAGHGALDPHSDKAYWLPIDAEGPDDPNAIIADDLTTAIRAQTARHVLVISDSCYSGAMRDGPIAIPPAVENALYLNKALAGTSRTLMSSGGIEPVADKGGNGHSVFANILLRALEAGDGDEFTAGKLFYDYVKVQVGGDAAQTPDYKPIQNSGTSTGDFVFVRKESQQE